VIIGVLFISLLAADPAKAWGPHRLTPQEQAECAKLAKTNFKEWKKADLSKLPAPNPDTVKLPYQLPLALVVYNHKPGIFSREIDERELAFHLEQARTSYRACGIEVVVQSVRYLEGPKFIDNLERTDPDHPKSLSPQERCLFAPTHQDGIVNVYFVEDANNEHGDSVSHAYSKKAFMSSGEYAAEKERRFTGTAVITDASLSGGKARDIVMPHEISHVVLDASHSLDRKPDIMNNDIERTTIQITNEQCATARASPFVTLRKSPDDFEAEAATRCDPSCPIELHQWGERKVDVCAGVDNDVLKKIAFCDAEAKLVNPFAIASSPKIGTPACRYALLRRASLEARKSKSHADPTVAEGGGLFIYEDCRIVKKGPQAVLFESMGETVPDYSTERVRYCEIMK
jgi:hypothetical protein